MKSKQEISLETLLIPRQRRFDKGIVFADSTSRVCGLVVRTLSQDSATMQQRRLIFLELVGMRACGRRGEIDYRSLFSHARARFAARAAGARRAAKFQIPSKASSGCVSPR